MWEIDAGEPATARRSGAVPDRREKKECFSLKMGDQVSLPLEIGTLWTFGTRSRGKHIDAAIVTSFKQTNP